MLPTDARHVGNLVRGKIVVPDESTEPREAWLTAFLVHFWTWAGLFLGHSSLLNPGVMEFTRGLSGDATVTMRRGAKAPEAVAFGKRVREMRDGRGSTQEQLAEATGMTAVQISRIENGVHEPKLTTIIKLAHAFGITLAELFRPFDKRK